jgi:hypothetical protein
VYTFVRRADAQRMEAQKFAIEITEVVRKVTGLDVILNTQVYGPANRIFWIARGIDSLDDFEKKMAHLMADPEYLAKVREGMEGQYIVPGSIEDTLLKTVEF